MEDMDVPDVINDVFLPQGRYPENFVLIFLWEVCQEGGVKKGGTWRTLGVSYQRHEGGVIFDVMHDVFFPQGRYPKHFVLISLWEVCQEGGVQEGGYLEDVEGS